MENYTLKKLLFYLSSSQSFYTHCSEVTKPAAAGRLHRKSLPNQDEAATEASKKKKKSVSSLTVLLLSLFIIFFGRFCTYFFQN